MIIPQNNPKNRIILPPQLTPQETRPARTYLQGSVVLGQTKPPPPSPFNIIKYNYVSNLIAHLIQLELRRDALRHMCPNSFVHQHKENLGAS